MPIDFAKITELLQNEQLRVDPELGYKLLAIVYAAKELSFALGITAGAVELGKATILECDWNTVFKAQDSLISIMRTAVLGEMGLYLSLLELMECACPNYRFSNSQPV